MVPNTGGLKGIEASAAAGAVAGDAGKILEVISQVTDAQKEEVKAYLDSHEVRVAPAPGDVVFDIIVTLTAGEDTAEKRGEVQGLTKQQKAERIAKLEKEMREAAKMLEFELAAALRDQIIELRGK